MKYKTLAAVCAAFLLAVAPLSWAAERCDSWKSGVCFGLPWKTATPGDVRQWLSDGGDVTTKDQDGETPLHWAASFNENPAVITALIDANADVTAKDKYGRTPLHLAASYNENPAVITALIDANADVTAKDKYGRTPLHLAASYNENPAVITALIDANADVTAKDKYGRTPLHRALFNKHFRKIIPALVANGADINIGDNDGDTPLDRAQGRAKDIVQPGVAAYLSNPSQVAADARAYKRKAAEERRRIAEEKRKREIAERKAAEERRARQYPLIAAVLDGDAARVAELLDGGADVNQTDETGKTAFDYAFEKGEREIAKLLHQHGGRPGK